MRKLKGYFTAEAAVLLPVMLAAWVVLIYLVIFVYDKTLMIHDINAVAAMIRDEHSSDRDKVMTICEEAFAEIKNEHPYLAMSNLTMNVSVKGNVVHLVLSGDWDIPLYAGYSKTITKERDVKRINPAEKMYLTENIKNMIRGSNDEDSDGVRD